MYRPMKWQSLSDNIAESVSLLAETQLIMIHQYIQRNARGESGGDGTYISCMLFADCQ